MTRLKNARISGIAFLAYIAVGVCQMVIGRGSSSGDDMAARLASVASHATPLHINAVLGLLTSLLALTLAVTLSAITRDEDIDLAALVFSCRIMEGVFGALPAVASLGLLWLATGPSKGSDATLSLAGLLFNIRATLPVIAALFFAVGSTVFSYLLLRGRIVPAALSWLGLFASAVLVLLLPAQLSGLLASPATQYMWLPMAVFEVVLAVWLIVRGAAISSAKPVSA